MTATRDLRPQARIGVFGRRISHWTPRYLYYRARAIAHQRRHPDAPSLTAEGVRLLASLLRPVDRGVEWGSGNSTIWFARRTAHLVSFETNEAYYPQVRAELARAALDNVDYRLMSFADSPDEDAMHRSAWVRAAADFADESLDYALVDSSPRGCLATAIAPKLKPGGLLILDNADWFIPPPATMLRTATAATVPPGAAGSRCAGNQCWTALPDRFRSWRQIWTSDGVQMTLIFVKV
jgi:predicted O-methyltransferase YrrM